MKTYDLRAIHTRADNATVGRESWVKWINKSGWSPDTSDTSQDSPERINER